MAQQSFDLEQLLVDQHLEQTPWNGAPLAYTEDYYTGDELQAAFERWQLEHGSFGSIPRSRMWHRSLGHGRQPLTVRSHVLDMLTADGGGHQANCAGCRWHHIDADESAAVAAWHDHAMPGWRSLPVAPARIPLHDAKGRPTPAILTWIAEHYPEQWQFDGAPIITPRRGTGTRAVAARSPLGGYDVAIETVEQAQRAGGDGGSGVGAERSSSRRPRRRVDDVDASSSPTTPGTYRA